MVLKYPKNALGLLVYANAIGEKEKLLIIGKAKHPHSFPKNMSDMAQHITYKSNKHGWMTTESFMEFLNSLNNKMKLQGHHILMFLDNCPSYPKITMSNIKMCFTRRTVLLSFKQWILG